MRRKLEVKHTSRFILAKLFSIIEFRSAVICVRIVLVETCRIAAPRRTTALIFTFPSFPYRDT